jgi:hypothetical protein
MAELITVTAIMQQRKIAALYRHNIIDCQIQISLIKKFLILMSLIFHIQEYLSLSC